MKLILNGGIDALTNATIIPATTLELATSAITVVLGEGDEFNSILGYAIQYISFLVHF
jgi:hypothetical protein